MWVLRGLRGIGILWMLCDCFYFFLFIGMGLFYSLRSLNLLNGVSPVMGEFIVFHDKTLVVIIFISALVVGLIYLIVIRRFRSNILIEHNIVEFF